MVQEFTTTVQIQAPLEAIWTILTDAAGYEHWNPEIIGVQGLFAANERIKARVKVKAGKGMAVRTVVLKITHFDAPHRMDWTGGMPLGLFTGVREITLKPAAGGATEFRMHLRMSGPMCGMILKQIGDRQPEIDSFARGLKERAERR